MLTATQQSCFPFGVIHYRCRQVVRTSVLFRIPSLQTCGRAAGCMCVQWRTSLRCKNRLFSSTWRFWSSFEVEGEVIPAVADFTHCYTFSALLYDARIVYYNFCNYHNLKHHCSASKSKFRAHHRLRRTQLPSDTRFNSTLFYDAHCCTH